MVQRDSQFSSSDSTLSAGAGERTETAPVHSVQPQIASVWLAVCAICAALAAGALSWYAGEIILGSYHADLNPPIKNNPSPEDIRKLKSGRIHSATFTYMTLGGLMGFAMGMAGGLAGARRSPELRPRFPVLLLGPSRQGSHRLASCRRFTRSMIRSRPTWLFRS